MSDETPLPSAETPRLQFHLLHAAYAIAFFAATATLWGAAGWWIAGVIFAGWVYVFWLPTSRLLRWVQASISVALVFGAVVISQPFLSQSRTPSNHTACGRELRQLEYALLNYHSNYRRFPSATRVGKDGKTPYSWRVAILPFIEAGNVWEAYDFSEPWNGPNNSRLARAAPVFRCPHDLELDPEATSYVMVTGERTKFDAERGDRFAMLSGDPKHFVFLVESPRPVHWMEPRDLTFDEIRELLLQVDEQAIDSTWSNPSGPRVYVLGHRYLREAAEKIGWNRPDDYTRWHGTMHRKQWEDRIRWAVFLLLAVVPSPWVWFGRNSDPPTDAEEVDRKIE